MIALKVALLSGLLLALCAVVARFRIDLAYRICCLSLLLVLAAPWVAVIDITDAPTLAVEAGPFIVRKMTELPDAPAVYPQAVSTSAAEMPSLLASYSLVEVWLAGSCFALGVLILALLRTASIAGGARRLRGLGPLPVHVASKTRVPFLWGLPPARIVLPLAYRSWGPRMLNHVRRHEHVHFRRKDQWWTVINALTLVIYWWHPLVWVLAREHRRLMELSCDLEAVKRGARRLDYAASLLELARAGHTLAPAMARSFDTTRRIEALLNRRRPRPTLLGKAAAVLLSGASLVTVAAAFPTPMRDAEQLVTFVSTGLSTHRGLGIEPGRMQIVAVYDGAPNMGLRLDVELDGPEGSTWLSLSSIRKFDEAIPSWEFALAPEVTPTGRVRVSGVVPDGVVDGVAYGVVWRDHGGRFDGFRSVNPGQSEYPLAICAWPLKVLPFVAKEEVPVYYRWQVETMHRAICGSELVPDGSYRHAL